MTLHAEPAHAGSEQDAGEGDEHVAVQSTSAARVQPPVSLDSATMALTLLE